MKDYVIFMDTAGDLSETYIQENDIRLVPMHYTLGKEDRICAKMEDEALLKRFYDGQRGGDLTQTSQITPQVYIDLFEPELKAGRDVIYISLSSGLTKTFDNVNLARGHPDHLCGREPQGRHVRRGKCSPARRARS